jgi:hypothetical protein
MSETMLKRFIIKTKQHYFILMYTKSSKVLSHSEQVGIET